MTFPRKIRMRHRAVCDERGRERTREDEYRWIKTIPGSVDSLVSD
jgi:hypothetical protein